MQPLVLGAAGFIGLNLVDTLLVAGILPRCGRRRRTNVLALRTRKVPMVQASLDDGPALVEAMRGCDVVFHCAGHYPRLSLDRTSTLVRGRAEIRGVLDACAEAGVRRLVYVSSTATVAPAPGGPSDERHVFPNPPGFGTYHDLKWVMEQEVLAERRFEAVVACPSGCIGPWDLRVGTSALLVGLARGMPLPHPDGLVNLVDVRDVGQALFVLGTVATPPGRVLLAPREWMLHDLLVSLAPRYGVATPGPLLSAAEAVALADAEEARCAREGGRPALSREIVDLVIHTPHITSERASALPGVRWRPFEDSLRDFERWARSLRLIP